jgi:YgiT-type zinc finger domain-containing protein
MATTCYECGKKTMKRKSVEYLFHGVLLGTFPAEVCSSCGEQFFGEAASVRIEAAAKAKGVWGLQAVTKVAKSGNSLDVRISKKLAKFVGMHQGDEVVVHPEGKKRLVIEME